MQETTTCHRGGSENFQHYSQVMMDFRGFAFSNRLGALSSAGSFLWQVLQGIVPPEFGQKKDVLHILTVIFNSKLTFSYCYLVFGLLQPINSNYIIHYICSFPAVIERA